MRKIIYIGQGCQQSVYYNTKTREALTTQSSASSETDGAISSKKSKWPWVLFFVFLLVTIIGIWIRSLLAPFRLSEWMAPIHLVAILFVFIGSVYGFEKLFYSGAKSLVPASEEQFKDAVESSTFWRKSPDKEPTVDKIILYLFAILVLLFVFVIVVFFAIPGTFLPYYEHEWFEPSMFMVPIGATIVPISVVLLLFQNNPIRWLLAVRKYKQGKILFGEEKN
ncbi:MULTISPECIES: hypothetical protein [Streptococcus]|uniref:hypothetical protein n=1 Tax=Streptococcus TaxID=1301 RepID=UPI0008A100C3|nr:MULTISPECIES: hypothetical protein [Streptococcus]MDU7194460.1 hypothetical protein [Streptococcus sp.]OFL48262.1 hypothetical protein HMPREF2766_00595 [Streptococcus sp. HMSC076C08]OFP31384.1 hypothetical protein HMPREF2991_00320 [Streptococcus sp. HMSC072D07]QQB99417.1 hypothetical protein I6I32_05080 [Streptococcus oralis]